MVGEETDIWRRVRQADRPYTERTINVVWVYGSSPVKDGGSLQKGLRTPIEGQTLRYLSIRPIVDTQSESRRYIPTCPTRDVLGLSR